MSIQLEELNEHDRLQLRLGRKTDQETVDALLDRIEDLERENARLQYRLDRAHD